MKRLVWALAIVAIFSVPAQAQTLRSDTPLWTYQNEPDQGLYPQHFTDAVSFGCSIPLQLGVYRRDWNADGEDDAFVRLQNYGVFHCALLYGEAYDRADAEAAFEDHAWLIMLDESRRPDGRADQLLALQIGVRAGSRYVLLRRRGNELSAPLEELDWKCPADAEHRKARLDIWVQDSCVIASKADLRRVARAAAGRPIIATWTAQLADDESASAAPQR
ncbi:MAG: hypothetical protein KJ728_06245 [Alphaproteobacteria bacterium]|uniref:hypothetical protein n=1 Tax=Brevundimonas sp. TaxID=1871086 RepID=UPI001D215C3B|nr:hypothetical protein [Alphaproteobacteria bacterium]MBU1521006.1 hypothetical protein [Alphaproteobacteria bacterium]MBU2030236.1 hypothetical protein [Alphaproteobacteria bacterium]MBU2164528.1 hypothetical protein [Alphaproteobacteria bacterium]MBU2232455.1 hypothetical protein [Alphaproteobacteria bacterium]